MLKGWPPHQQCSLRRLGVKARPGRLGQLLAGMFVVAQRNGKGISCVTSVKQFPLFVLFLRK